METKIIIYLPHHHLLKKTLLKVSVFGIFQLTKVCSPGENNWNHQQQQQQYDMNYVDPNDSYSYKADTTIMQEFDENEFVGETGVVAPPPPPPFLKKKTNVACGWMIVV